MSATSAESDGELPARAPPVTVIAIGNPYRRDDGAGAAVLAALAERFAGDPRVRLVELDGEPVRLVQAWEGSVHVWVVDAVRSSRPAGTIHVVDSARLSALDDRGVGVGGGHLLGLAEAVDLARALDLMPAALHVVGIEGETFDHGEGLSPAVEQAVIEAAALVQTAIDAVLCGGRRSL